MKLKQLIEVHKGFTLIEMAVVLVVVGVLLGSFIGTLGNRIDVSRVSEAETELEDIKQAMMAYAFVNGFLPCPDCDEAGGSCTAAMVGDGLEDYDGAQCSENEDAGNVPWVTLGLGRGDPWSNHYRYAVQNIYADQSIPFALNTVMANPFSIQEPDYVADATGATPHDLANNVVAVIFTHGKNGFGAISEDNTARSAIPAENTDELENDDNDTDYYIRPETRADAAISGGEFDDLLIWISEYELKAKMVEAGKLP
jgi:prepilin-type N-terminal cleavage/methylation domain-containing protein